MKMFFGVLFGLAATTAALPLVRELATENEGVNIPVYKPWFNPYSTSFFGNQFSSVLLDKFSPNYFTYQKFLLDNYDSFNVFPFVYRQNYFSKYLRPDMFTNFFNFPNMFYNLNMGSNYDGMNMFWRNTVHGVNNYDYVYRPYVSDVNSLSYRYRPYSPEYMYGSMFYPFHYVNNLNFNSLPYFYQYMNNQNTFNNVGFSDYLFRPFSPEYMNGNTFMSNNVGFSDYKFRPFSPEYMNGYLYPYYMNGIYNNYQTYRPYIHQFMYGNNFHDLMYNNMNYDYMYAPYSPEYMNLQKTYPIFKGTYWDNLQKPYFPGYPNHFVDMSYSTNNMLGYNYFNNYFGANQFPFFNNYFGANQFPFYNYFGANQFPFYNNYFGVNQFPFYNNYFGANQFPDNFNYMRFKRDLSPNSGIGQDGITSEV